MNSQELLFHITPERNYPSIMTDSIKPYTTLSENGKRVKGLSNRTSFDKVFLTDCVIHIIRWQSGLSWMQLENAIIMALAAIGNKGDYESSVDGVYKSLETVSVSEIVKNKCQSFDNIVELLFDSYII